MAPEPPAAAPVAPPGTPFINVGYATRIAVLADSARLNNSTLNFLPSAIPVAGQQFYGAPWRAAVLGNGNLVDLAGAVESQSLGNFQAVTRVFLQNAQATSDSSAAGGSAIIQQAYGQWNAVTFGVADSAFGNVDAVPEVMDLAGPNARVTVLGQGTGTGQGRLSYTLLEPEDGSSGFTALGSLETPVPEIRTSISGNTVTGTNTATFARYPDLIAALKYSDGRLEGKKYIQTFNLQLASIARSLGLENDAETLRPSDFGWGESLSGAYWFLLGENAPTEDAVFFSVTYGEGISHYVVDLRGNAASGGADAMFTGTDLVALPVFAWYASYLHNWTNRLRSTVTYSQVNLSSINVPQQPVSPYHQGLFGQVNLVYHNSLNVALDPSKPAGNHNFYTGIEYLFGQRETLDGAVGQDHRIMWVTSISK